MSLQAIEAAVRTPAPSNAAWQVRMILAYHHNAQTGRCFPSYERMAEETGLAKSSVVRGIKELAAAGQIEVVKGRRAGTFNAPNSYKLLFLTHEKLVAEKERRSGYDRRTTRPKQEPSPSTLRSEGESAPKRKRSQRRAVQRRMTPDWTPSKDLLVKARGLGFTEPEIQRIIEDFRDYYIGRGEISAQWGNDFSRWLRNQVTFKEDRNAKEERRAAADARAGRRNPSAGDSLAGFYASVTADPGGRGGREGGGSDGSP